MKCPSASSQERIAAARMPSSREAAPLHVAARPTTTLRPAYGSSSAYSGSARAPSPSAPHTSASSVTPISQLASRGRSSSRPGASNSARASSIAAELDEQQRERGAPGDQHRVQLDESPHRRLDLRQPALLAADVEHRLRVGVDGVLGLPVAADLERLVGELLGLVEPARQLGARAAQERRPPQPDRTLQRLGELGRGGDLDVGALRRRRARAGRRPSSPRPRAPARDRRSARPRAAARPRPRAAR